jgi:Tfp pilus assembly protein PilN
MRAVNLLPRETAKKTRKLPPIPVLTGVAAAFLVFVVLGAGFFLESANVAKKRTAVDEARAELSLIPAPKQPDAVSSTLAGEATLRVAAVQQALNGRIAWDRVLREISLVLPRDVWLNSLALTAPTTTSLVPTTPPPTDAAPVVTVNSFTMDGKAFSHEGVARLLTRLALVRDLENITLVSSTRIVVGKRNAVQFSITAGIRPSGGTS